VHKLVEGHNTIWGKKRVHYIQSAYRRSYPHWIKWTLSNFKLYIHE